MTDGAGATLACAKVHVAPAARRTTVVGPVRAVVPDGTAAGQEPCSWRPESESTVRADSGPSEPPQCEPGGPSMQQDADLHQRGDAGPDSSSAVSLGCAAPNVGPRTKPVRRCRRKAVGAARAVMLAAGAAVRDIVVRQRGCALVGWKGKLWCRCYCRGRRAGCPLTSRAR